MNEKHREVTTWLEILFGGDAVPQYEVDPFTVDRLYHLLKLNEKQEKHGQLILEDMCEKTEEYKVEGDRLRNILNNVGLLPGALSQSGTTVLRSLADSAVTLEVPNASDTNLLLASSELSQQNMKISEERRMEERLTAQLLSKTKAAKIQASSLKRAMASLDEQSKSQGPDLQNKAKQAAFLSTKSREYKKHIQEMQKELEQNKVEPSIYHSSLVKKSEELKALKEQLHPMKAKLNSYHQLPPDMSLALVKVEELKRELADIEEELTKLINVMHM